MDHKLPLPWIYALKAPSVGVTVTVTVDVAPLVRVTDLVCVMMTDSMVVIVIVLATKLVASDVTNSVEVKVRVGAVTVLGKIPKQEQALEYPTGWEHAVAYGGIVGA
jgi:hypothetical protein